MDVGIALAIVAAAFLLIAVVAMARTAWRMVRGNEELEPGGSMGRQMFGSTDRSD